MFDRRVEQKRRRDRDRSMREERDSKSRKERGTEAEWKMTPVRAGHETDWADPSGAPMPALPGTAKSARIDLKSGILVVV